MTIPVFNGLTPMKIEIRKDPPRDAKVYVDGVRWATLDKSHHSRYGTKYKFRSVVPWTQDGPLTWVDANGKHCEYVKSSKRSPEHNPDTLEQRLIEATRLLIKQGVLRHPDVLRQEHAEHQKLVQEAVQRAAKITAAKRKKAVLAIFDRHGELALAENMNWLIDDIVEHIDDLANIS